MKTLTEFAGINLKNAAKVKNELSSGDKTPEELSTAMGETLKLEGDRLTFLVNALDMVSDKLQDLKRVVVFTLAENEKAPAKAVQKGEQYYLVEFYPSLNPPKESRPLDSRNDRGDKKRGKRGKGDRQGPGKFGQGRPGSNQERPQTREPRVEIRVGAEGGATPSDGSNPTNPEGRARRPSRGHRKPFRRPPAEAGAAQAGPPKRVTIKAKDGTTFEVGGGAAPVATAAGAAAPASAPVETTEPKTEASSS